MAATEDTAAAGRTLIERRMAEAPAAVAAVPTIFPELLSRPRALPRALVTTGIGTSEGHARHLAEVAARFADQPARFASTGSLRAGPPPGSERDWLVVFSQGLSANARYALQDIRSWGGVILVTGLTLSMAPSEGLSAEKRQWLESLRAEGAVILDMGCGAEYGALIRVIGARVGYAMAWSLLRTLSARQLKADGLARGEEVSFSEIQEQAAARAGDAPIQSGTALPLASEAGATEPAAFFSSERSVVIVSEGGEAAFAEHLALKISEGMLRPQPRCVDVLEFAHGPTQSLAGQPASFIYLLPAATEGADADPVGEVTGVESETWLARFRATLDPEWHAFCVIRAQSPAPFSVLEFEAWFDVWILSVLEATGGDIVAWPGQDREASLYAQGPPLSSLKSASPSQAAGDAASAPAASADVNLTGESRAGWILEDAVSPEVEAWVAAGRTTALIALGSVEQHGAHLPLGTDRWIADALAQGLAERLTDAVALPAIPLGCASEHMDFAGTLHVEPATLEAVLVDQLKSLRQHGFERAFLFTAHGGNLDALEEMRARLIQSASPLALRVETDLRVGFMQSEAVAAEALPGRTAGPHGGEYETSLVAWLRPGSIRREGLMPGRMVEPGEGQSLFYPSLRPNAESGVLGDPSQANASRGERYLAAWIDLLEEAYRDAF